MSDDATDIEIAAALGYEELLVPAVFQSWTTAVVEAAALRPGDRVLDVACGTGVLAREALTLVGPGGSVIGLDPGPGMLTVARRLTPAGDWRQGTAEAMPFPDRDFDAVVSQFGLMFFRDAAQAIREMVRVLRPAGRLAVAVWDSLERTPAYAAEVRLLDSLGGRAAGDALRLPFALGDTGRLRALFEDVGLESVSVDTRSHVARFPSVRVMVEADLRGWLPAVGVTLEEPTIQAILLEAPHALGEFVASSGEAVFEMSAHIASARRA